MKVIKNESAEQETIAAEKAAVNESHESLAKEQREWREKEANELKKEYEKKLDELSKKNYLVKGEKEICKNLLDFLENEVQWKSSEAIGVINLYEEIKKQYESKEKHLFLTAVDVKAIVYFINKKEGKTYKEALEFKNKILEPIMDVIEKIQEDEKQLDEIKRKWTEVFQGAKFE